MTIAMVPLLETMVATTVLMTMVVQSYLRTTWVPTLRTTWLQEGVQGTMEAMCMSLKPRSSEING